MVCEDIVLGKNVSKKGLEVNKAKISTIENLVPPMNVKGVRSFFGHTGFYKRFIKDFSKNVRPLCRFLEKDATFVFDESCLDAFMEIKKRLISAPIMIAPDWNIPLKLCTMLVILLLGPSWSNVMRIFCMLFTMLATPSMKHKRTTTPLKRRC